jgi:hypothetical protein
MPDEALHLSAGEVAASGDELDFVLVQDLSVDSRGRIYVVGHSEQVTVLDARGEKVRTIGRMGAGPGEFMGISSITVGAGDSLFVYDLQHQRVTVFAPDEARPAYSVQIASEFPRFPSAVRYLGPGHLLAMDRRAYGPPPPPGEVGEPLDVLRLVGADGRSLRDSVALLRRQRLIEVTHGRGSSVFRNPFSPRSIVHLAPGGRIVAAWTDSLRFNVYSQEGELLRVVQPSAAGRRQPITAAERDSLIDDYAEDPGLRPALREAIARLGLTTWPLLRDFIVDEREWIWYALHPARDAEGIEWVAVDSAGAARERLFLPTSARLWTVRGRTAYVTETDSLDVPRVVLYHLTPAPREGAPR